MPYLMEHSVLLLFSELPEMPYLMASPASPLCTQLLIRDASTIKGTRLMECDFYVETSSYY